MSTPEEQEEVDSAGLYNKELHYRMQRKVAQLTKVIYTLNVRADEHASELSTLQKEHQVTLEAYESTADDRVAIEAQRACALRHQLASLEQRLVDSCEQAKETKRRLEERCDEANAQLERVQQEARAAQLCAQQSLSEALDEQRRRLTAEMESRLDDERSHHERELTKRLSELQELAAANQAVAAAHVVTSATTSLKQVTVDKTNTSTLSDQCDQQEEDAVAALVQLQLVGERTSARWDTERRVLEGRLARADNAAKQWTLERQSLNERLERNARLHEAALGEAQAATRVLQEQLNEMAQASITPSEELVKALQKAVRERDSSIDALHRRLGEAEVQTRELKQTLSKTHSECEQLRKSSPAAGPTSANSLVATSASNSSALNNTAEQVRIALARQAAEHQRKMTLALDECRCAQREQIETLEAKMREVEREEAAREARWEHMERKMEEYRRQKHGLQSQVQALKHALQDANATLKHAHACTRTLDDQLAELRNHAASTERAFQLDLDAKVKMATQRVDEAWSKRLSQEASKLRKTLGLVGDRERKKLSEQHARELATLRQSHTTLRAQEKAEWTAREQHLMAELEGSKAKRRASNATVAAEQVSREAHEQRRQEVVSHRKECQQLREQLSREQSSHEAKMRTATEQHAVEMEELRRALLSDMAAALSARDTATETLVSSVRLELEAAAHQRRTEHESAMTELRAQCARELASALRTLEEAHTIEVRRLNGQMEDLREALASYPPESDGAVEANLQLATSPGPTASLMQERKLELVAQLDDAKRSRDRLEETLEEEKEAAQVLRKRVVHLEQEQRVLEQRLEHALGTAVGSGANAVEEAMQQADERLKAQASKWREQLREAEVRAARDKEKCEQALHEMYTRRETDLQEALRARDDVVASLESRIACRSARERDLVRVTELEEALTARDETVEALSCTVERLKGELMAQHSGSAGAVLSIRPTVSTIKPVAKRDPPIASRKAPLRISNAVAATSTLPPLQKPERERAQQ